MREFASAFVGGVVAAAIGVAAQYLITYRMIEKPKIDLDKKRVAIEAQKQIAQMIPILKSDCNVSADGLWSYYIKCDTKNIGQYSTWVSITKVYVAKGIGRKKIGSDAFESFTAKFSEGRTKYLAPPSSEGVLDFYLNVNKLIYPQGVKENGLMVNVVFDYKTIDDINRIVMDAFPEMNAAVENITSGGANINLELPPTLTSQEDRNHTQTKFGSLRRAQ